MHTFSLFVFLVLIQTVIAFDCYKFSKNEFATIKSCPYGCEYEYKIQGGRNEKESGGCADEGDPVGCRNKGSKTVCTCAENQCNKQGYDMQRYADSSEEHMNQL